MNLGRLDHGSIHLICLFCAPPQRLLTDHGLPSFRCFDARLRVYIWRGAIVEDGNIRISYQISPVSVVSLVTVQPGEFARCPRVPTADSHESRAVFRTEKLSKVYPSEA